MPTKDLYDKVGQWRGLRKDSPDIWRILARKSTFRLRSAAEDDPGFKQLVSYTLFLSDKRIFVMKRLKAQSESRLHGLLSVGVGGHMNPVPKIQWPGRRRISDLKSIAGLNTVREIREEVCVAGNPAIAILGFLNDDHNEVGKVHLGIVSVVNLPSPLLAVKETDKMMGAWIPLKDMKAAGRFESWSTLILAGVI